MTGSAVDTDGVNVTNSIDNKKPVEPGPVQEKDSVEAVEVADSPKPTTNIKPGLFVMADPYGQKTTGTTTERQPRTNETTEAKSGPQTNQTEPEEQQRPTDVTVTASERIQKVWNDMFEESTIAKFKDPKRICTYLKGTTPEFDAEEKTVTITLTSSFAEHEIKSVLAEVMTYLRKNTNIPNLAPKIMIKAEEVSAKPYQAGEKYEAMLKINPKLAELRKVLPDIDI